MTQQEKRLKSIILNNKIKYKSSRDQIIGKPISFRIQDDECKDIIYKYTVLNLSAREIGRQHQRQKQSIIYTLKKHNIPIISSQKRSRIYNVKENYFENIDCHKKAYWIGWIYADGAVSRNGKEIRIKLQVRDEYILEELKKDLGTSFKIKRITQTVKPGTLLHRCAKKKQYEHSILRICSAKMVLDLAKYGVVWNKTKNSTIKNIPKEFFSSFLLGQFEGDGCISFSPQIGHILTIIDNKRCCDFIKNNLDSILKIDVGFVNKHTNANVYIFRESKGFVLNAIYNLMYKNKDFTFCLERKFNKFTKMVNFYQNKLKYSNHYRKYK